MNSAIHKIGSLKIQYISSVNRILITRKNDSKLWTNSFQVIREILINENQRNLF